MKRSNHLSRFTVYPVCCTGYDTVLFARADTLLQLTRGECSTGHERVGHGACPVFTDPNRSSGTASIICNARSNGTSQLTFKDDGKHDTIIVKNLSYII
ncbi:hypothetical protein PUN28_000876 [Cardiocondyla obscurior]|uniref:Uncharacterized protein n=1 Tax=Cardiocondyla obscurior TaxID=286306 RepID=A0AAW2H1M1_9HYME